MADPAVLCAQLNKSLLREDVSGGYVWIELENFRLNVCYGYVIVRLQSADTNDSNVSLCSCQRKKVLLHKILSDKKLRKKYPCLW